MTKLIIIPEETLDRAYKRAIERIKAKHHSLPTHLSTNVEKDWQIVGDDMRKVFVDFSEVYAGDKPIGKVIG